eukprot:gene10834-biopygen2310
MKFKLTYRCNCEGNQKYVSFCLVDRAVVVVVAVDAVDDYAVAAAVVVAVDGGAVNDSAVEDGKSVALHDADHP